MDIYINYKFTSQCPLKCLNRILTFEDEYCTNSLIIHLIITCTKKNYKTTMLIQLWWTRNSALYHKTDVAFLHGKCNVKVTRKTKIDPCNKSQSKKYCLLYLISNIFQKYLNLIIFRVDRKFW